MPFKKKKQGGITVLSVILVIAMLAFTFRTYYLNANSKEFDTKNDGATQVLRTVIKAPRGEILDRYGRQIAVNRDGYNIVFNKAYVKDNLIDVILTLVNLLEKSDAEIYKG